MEIKYKKATIHQNIEGEERDTEVLLPILENRPKKKHIGIWGIQHKFYLLKCKPDVYEELSSSGQLEDYLYKIGRQASEMNTRLIDRMMKQQGVTEELKAANQMEWVRRMNAIYEAAREVVVHDIVYN